MIDLTGQRFGRLIVIDRANNYISNKGQKHSQWNCKCDCGNIVTIRGTNLKSGKSMSCGCLHQEVASYNHKRYNQFNIIDDYIVGYTSNTNEPFYFDLEDYVKVKAYCWYKGAYGYLCSNGKWKNREHIIAHILVMNSKNKSMIDHINHNKLDNRKCNLRTVDHSKNSMNTGIRTNNTSGVTGVYFNKKTKKWYARIKIHQKTIHLGTFANFEDAVEARKQAEQKYFGKYSYDNSISQNILRGEKYEQKDN